MIWWVCEVILYDWICYCCYCTCSKRCSYCFIVAAIVVANIIAAADVVRSCCCCCYCCSCYYSFCLFSLLLLLCLLLLLLLLAIVIIVVAVADVVVVITITIIAVVFIITAVLVTIQAVIVTVSATVLLLLLLLFSSFVKSKNVLRNNLCFLTNFQKKKIAIKNYLQSAALDVFFFCFVYFFEKKFFSCFSFLKFWFSKSLHYAWLIIVLHFHCH